MRLLIMGPPGAGKGTQAMRIAEHYGIPAISTGDIFRAMKNADTPLARQVRAIMESGGYVSDEITNEIVQDRLARPDCQGAFCWTVTRVRCSRYDTRRDSLAETGARLMRSSRCWPTLTRSSHGCSDVRRSTAGPTTTRKPSGYACRSTPSRPSRCSTSTAHAACLSRSTVSARSTRCRSGSSPHWMLTASAEPLSSSSPHKRQPRGHQPGCPIHGDQLSGLDLVRRLGHANDGGNAVLPRDHRAMGVRAAHLHHQAACCQEQRSPAGIGRRRDQDLAGLEMRPHRIEHDPRPARHCASGWLPPARRRPSAASTATASGSVPSERSRRGMCRRFNLWYASRRSATNAADLRRPHHAGRHPRRGRRHRQPDRSSPRRRARARPPSAARASSRAP